MTESKILSKRPGGAEYASTAGAKDTLGGKDLLIESANFGQSYT